MPINLPYVVYGTVTDTDSTNPNGAKVVLRNDRSGEKISTTTDSSGKYALDAGNLASGYALSDRLTSICSFGDASKSSSVVISESPGGKQLDLQLESNPESSDLNYCQVNDVLDELGDRTTSDITYERVRKIILRAESEIEERANTFKPVLISNEYHDFNQYTSYKSPEQLIDKNTNLLTSVRSDHWNTFYNDKFKLNKYPIIHPSTQLNGVTTTTATTLTVDSTTDFPSSGTIFIYNGTNGTEQITYTGKTATTFTGCTRAANATTATAHADNVYVSMISLSKNDASVSDADSWTSLEPQVGGGGDFVIDTDTGFVTIIDKLPSIGKRKFRARYTRGHLSVPKVVERLCVLLSVRDVLLSKQSSSQFDSIDSISLEGVSVTSGIATSSSYMNWLTQEIERLWFVVGQLTSESA